MYRVEISDDAQLDLIDTAFYIGLDNPQRAITFIPELKESYVKQLSTFPYSGVMYNEDKNVRTTTHKKYTAFYRVHEDIETVEILRIIRLSKPLEARGIEFN